MPDSEEILKAKIDEARRAGYDDATIRQNLSGVPEAVLNTYLPLPETSAPEQTATQPERGGAVGRFVGGAWEQMNPVPAMRFPDQVIRHPIQTAQGMGAAQGKPLQSAIESFNSGNYLEAARHALMYLIPLVGPVIDEAGNQMTEGDIAGALGKTLGLSATIAGPAAVKSVKLGGMFPNKNPVTGPAIRSEMEAGVRVPAAAATDSKLVQIANEAANETIGGAIIKSGFEKGVVGAQARRLRELTAQTGVPATTPLEAGQIITNKLISVQEGFQQRGNALYNEFYGAINSPENVQRIRVGSRVEDTGILDLNGNPTTRTVPITQDIATPVKISGEIRDALKPQWEEYKALAARFPDNKVYADAFRELDAFVSGADYMPAAMAEKSLGALKSIFRKNKSTDILNVKQKTAKDAADLLSDKIADAVRATGEENLTMLVNARKTWEKYHEVNEVLDTINKEPVRAFDSAVLKGDHGIEHLKAIKSHAPETLPLIGRAWLDDWVKRATSEGGFKDANSMYKSWYNLGDETKKMLYNEEHLKNLDNFFLTAKKIAELEPGKIHRMISTGVRGGGLILTYWHPVIGATVNLSGAALSLLLNSQTGTKLLVQGMKIPIGTGARRAAWFAEFMNLAGQSVQDSTEVQK